jgi:hypothetical protein
VLGLELALGIADEDDDEEARRRRLLLLLGRRCVMGMMM